MPFKMLWATEIMERQAADERPTDGQGRFSRSHVVRAHSGVRIAAQPKLAHYSPLVCIMCPGSRSNGRQTYNAQCATSASLGLLSLVTGNLLP